MNKEFIPFWQDKQFHSIEYFKENIKNILDNRLKIIGNSNKKLFEEVYPTVFVADHLGVSEIMFSNGSDPFDAKFKFSNGGEKYVECTCAKNGEEEQIIREHLNKYNFVSFNLPICSLGTKHKRDLQKQTISLSAEVENAVDKAFRLINMGIDKKKEKSKERAAYRGAILIVILSSVFSYQQDVLEKLKKRIYQRVWDISPFENIYLIMDNPTMNEDFFIKL